MVDCSRYFGTRIFHSVVVVVESYEYPNFALKYGNSRFPTALGSYPEYLPVIKVHEMFGMKFHKSYDTYNYAALLTLTKKSFNIFTTSF